MSASVESDVEIACGNAQDVTRVNRLRRRQRRIGDLVAAGKRIEHRNVGDRAPRSSGRVELNRAAVGGKVAAHSERDSLAGIAAAAKLSAPEARERPRDVA